MVKRILVALSGTSYTPIAVQCAVELAQRHNASVTGVTVVDLKSLSDVGPVPLGAHAAAHSLAEHRLAITQERIEEEIANFEKACDNANINYAVDHEDGDPFDLLLKLWRYHDLTIIGLRGLFEYGVVHQPDDMIVRVIHHGVRPIIAVSHEHHPIKRVLIAYNGSHESAMAMKRFAQAHLWADVTVKVACFGFEDEAALPLLTDATVYLRAHDYAPETESLPGYPTEGLLKHSREWQADLVVMGSTSRRRITKLLKIGETALEALIHADVPLFLSQ